MKERLLVLAKACPIVSKSYEHLVCVAGITDKGEWRRVYPVPWKVFWKDKGSPFKKKSWIEYELLSDEPSDHRPESRKVIPETIKLLEEASFFEIKKMLDEKLTSLEELNKADHTSVSLGVVKPRIIDFVWKKAAHYEELVEKQKQQTLNKSSAVMIDIPEREFRYKFKCSDSCNIIHDMLCEDWEVSELFRNCKKKLGEAGYEDLDAVCRKVKEKMFDFMKQKKDLYFVVGTEYRFGTYMIVGLICPRKNDVY
jgi:hypothetical protein